MYDITLIPIRTVQGQPLGQMTGFQAAAPQKRPARSRSEDVLILSLIIHGEEAVSPDLQTAWLDRLSQIFYKTSGSVTSALRSLIESLNLTLMDMNHKTAREGSWATGAVTLVAVHKRSLFIAQSGPIHAYTLTHAGLKHYADTSQTDRGLGLSRTPSIRYYQSDLGTGGYLFMSDKHQETWSEERLIVEGFPELEQLQRRLLNQAPLDFRLDLVQISAGEGLIKVLQPVSKPVKTHPETDSATPEILQEPETETPDRTSDDAFTQGENLQDTREVQVSAPQIGLESPSPEDEIIAEQGDELEQTEAMSEPESQVNPPADEAESQDEVPAPTRLPMGNIPHSQAKEPPPKASQPKIDFAQLRQEGLQGLAGFFDWWHKTWDKIGAFFKNLFVRVAPEKAKNIPQLSRGTLLWIAVIVPLVVVAIAVGVYLSRGQRQEYEFYIEQAELAAQAALSAEDPAVQRSQWVQSLNYLDQADDIRDSEELAALRLQAQDELDILDGAVRLPYQPALVDTLSADINISKIVSYGMDLYLYDDVSAWVIHAVRDNNVYEVDTDFLCAPGNYSGGALGAIVDMDSLPINNPYQAHILTIDDSGSIAYCGPGMDPVVQSLPDLQGNASEGLRIAYENNTLYVLIPGNNAIWTYSATNGQFLDPPENYFKDADVAQIPDLTGIVDLDVNGPELYLLRANGSLVDCVYSGLPANPVTCQNPVQYTEAPAGADERPLNLPESNFTTVFYTPPPTPLVNILDANNAEIYRFSLRFRLHQRLRPDLGNYEVTPSQATAFAVGEIEPLVFLAFGNQVFYAYVE